MVGVSLVLVVGVAVAVLNHRAALGGIPEADMAPDPVFMATQRSFGWRTPGGMTGTDCLNVDRRDGKRWRQFIAYKSYATDSWVPADEAAAARAALPMVSRGCTLAASGLGAEMPSTAEPGIYRWCGLDYSECYVFEYRPASFEHMFEVLNRWVAVTGDAWVPPNAEFEGERLGLWADSMRYQKRTRRLSEEQIERLKSLPGWAWTRFRPADQRQDMAPEPVFMATQRNWQRDDLRDPEAPGTECAVIDRWNGKQWLQRFVRTSDDAGWVPADEPAGNCQLDTSDTISVAMPSELYRGVYRWCDLAYEECYAFEFIPSVDFRRMLRKLEKWTDDTGNADVPIDAEYKGVHLGLWVDAMRYRYEHGTLHPRRVAQLEALPGWTWRSAR